VKIGRILLFSQVFSMKLNNALEPKMGVIIRYCL